MFELSKDIRKAIYTTNAIESVNSVIRKSTKTRKLFPNDEAALKVFLAIQAASKKWTMPIHDWNSAMNQFIIFRGAVISLPLNICGYTKFCIASLSTMQSKYTAG